MESFIGCPATGLYKNGKPPTGKYLSDNLLKNRYKPPTRFDPTVTLEAMLKPGNDLKRWDPKRQIGARLTGYVAFVIENFQGEMCNCFKLDDAHSDTHVDLVLKPEDAGDFTKHVVVEVTPRMKFLAKKRGLDWSTQGLVKQFYRRKVTVEGWLFLDAEHAKDALNTNPANKSRDWRATCWEIHPVTSLKGLKG